MCWHPGEFVLDDAEKTPGVENADFAQVQLATVLDMLPGLLKLPRAARDRDDKSRT